MSGAGDVLARCTRNGAIQWGQVAKQLGVSVDKARRMYDPVSSARHDPQQLADDKSPLSAGMGRGRKCAEGEGLKAMILGLLERHGKLSAEDLASRIQSTPGSVRRRLVDLAALHLVENDHARSGYERTWVLTATGLAHLGVNRPGSPAREAINPADVVEEFGNVIIDGWEQMRGRVNYHRHMTEREPYSPDDPTFDPARIQP